MLLYVTHVWHASETQYFEMKIAALRAIKHTLTKAGRGNIFLTHILGAISVSRGREGSCFHYFTHAVSGSCWV